MRQKTYWTSQTVTAHKDGWPSLLVTTSVQGGPVTLAAPSHGRKGSQVLAGKSGPRGGGREGVWPGHPVYLLTTDTAVLTDSLSDNKIPNRVLQ